ncbi:restriction endonuclease [Corallococcus sp. AB038B]|uniref:restriction endonuclease n=1 Tax=Corallococcus sp. AB038B TaxID=2316718 RepID=UPI000EE2B9F5|nr:restriction endonuclease [Corallococcus sp. AB038B]RKH93608.1 hypothetical protein D7Y04_40095 [Corallococcus sp. AB038B]
MTWQQYERAILEKFWREFQPPHFRVEPSGGNRHYYTGRHSGELRQLDVAVYRRDATAPFLVVDAKHWQNTLDISDVESFISFVDDVGATQGVLVASSGFSEASPRRAAGAPVPIHLEIVTAKEALELDWLWLGRKLFPQDWAYHRHLGHALRLIEGSGSAAAISDAVEGVPFEEWEAAVSFAINQHRREAQHFLIWVATKHDDSGWRFNAARHLAEIGLLTESIRSQVVALETDPTACAILDEM